jgi:hypothetical protein
LVEENVRMFKTETYKIFSLCDLFRERRDLYDYFLDNIMNGCATDCLIKYTLYDGRGKTKQINDILIENGAIINETVLIEIDY